jgi:hypothetical protein
LSGIDLLPPRTGIKAIVFEVIGTGSYVVSHEY